MRGLFLTVILLFVAHLGFSQTRFMLSAEMDVIKTDFQDPF